MTNLYITCGCPGCGKSTWIKNNIKSFPNAIHVSRDVIRFNTLKDGDSYFASETKVFNLFVNEINNAIQNPSIENVFIDATHLNEKSRSKLLDRLHLQNTQICILNFNVPLETCIARNEMRKNNPRAYVPVPELKRMFSRHIDPTFTERYRYTKIVNIDALGRII